MADVVNADAVPAPHSFECGCFLYLVATGDGTRELRLSPCRPDCRVVTIAVEAARDAGKPVERRAAS